MTDLFDIQDARMRLQAQRRELVAEISASRQLQQRFNDINQRMRNHQSKNLGDVSSRTNDGTDDLSMLYANTETEPEDSYLQVDDTEAEEDISSANDVEDLDFDIDDITPRFPVREDNKAKPPNSKNELKNSRATSRKSSKGNEEKKSRSSRVSRAFVGVEDMVSYSSSLASRSY